jgi:uncharacterized protein (TIGR00251 family)
VFVRVKVLPGSGRTGFHSALDDGYCKICLKAPPVDGKANAELVRWLAKQFGVSSGSVQIRSGITSRRKTVRIEYPSVFPVWYHG